MKNSKHNSELFDHPSPSAEELNESVSLETNSASSTPLGLSTEEFDRLVQEGNIPRNISELDEMKSTLKILVDWNSLMTKNATPEERNSVF